MADLAAIEFDALVAKHLHARLWRRWRFVSRLVDYLALAVPILWVPIQLGLFNQYATGAAELVWAVLAAALAGTALAKIAFQVDNRVADHARLLDENSTIAHEARSLAGSFSAAGDKVADLERRARELNNEDILALQEPSLRLRQYAYRRAVMEIVEDAVDAVCAACGESVYDYRRGDCSMCGTKTRR